MDGYTSNTLGSVAIQFINTSLCTHYWYSWVVISNTSRSTNFLKSKWIFVRRLKTAPSSVYGFGREKELCSPYDFLNLKQFDRFVGESGVNPTLEGG